MGKFFDDEDADDEELEQISQKHKQFSPRDLNEAEVNSLFTSCLATDKTINKESIPLFVLSNNSIKRFEDYQLDIDSLNSNKKNILYLFGQLNIAHNNPSASTITAGIIKYDHTSWLTNENINEIQQTLFKLYALGFMLDLNSAIYINGNIYSMTFRQNLKPTLSRNDPNFNKWWAEHKSEWEDQPETKKESTPLVKRPGGTEPGDQ